MPLKRTTATVADAVRRRPGRAADVAVAQEHRHGQLLQPMVVSVIAGEGEQTRRCRPARVVAMHRLERLRAPPVPGRLPHPPSRQNQSGRLRIAGAVELLHYGVVPAREIAFPIIEPMLVGAIHTPPTRATNHSRGSRMRTTSLAAELSRRRARADRHPDEFADPISAFDAALLRNGDNPFTNMGKTITYAEVDPASREFAAYLLVRAGPERRATASATAMPNCLQYPTVAVFGVLRAGLTVVNVNPMYTARRLKHQLVDSSATVLVVLDNFGPRSRRKCWRRCPACAQVTTRPGRHARLPQVPDRQLRAQA